MMILLKQVRILHALLPKDIKNDPKEKAALVVQFTEDTTKRSVKDLTEVQANFLIMSLGGSPVLPNNRYLFFDFNNVKHRKVLSLLHELGWETKKGDKFIADMSRFANWLLSKRSPVNKPLQDMTPKECNKIITALTNMI